MCQFLVRSGDANVTEDTLKVQAVCSPRNVGTHLTDCRLSYFGKPLLISVYCCMFILQTDCSAYSQLLSQQRRPAVLDVVTSQAHCYGTCAVASWLLTYQFRILEIQIKFYLWHTFLKSNFKLLLWCLRVGYGLSRAHGLRPPDDKGRFTHNMPRPFRSLAMP